MGVLLDEKNRRIGGLTPFYFYFEALADPYAHILRSFQLDDNEVAFLVNAKKIDASLRFFPFAKFPGNYKSVERDYVYLVFQQTLQVQTLAHSGQIK